jgi:iron complex outermembrane receptor protein
MDPVSDDVTLSGKITDKETGEPLIGVELYIPDLKKGTITNVDGTYVIGNLPEKNILLQVNYLGYKTIIENIDLATSRRKDFAMEAMMKEMPEIIITGASQAREKNRTPTPISIIPRRTLLQNSATNIIDAIALEPGVSQITSGPSISKPVIRGLGYNRVVVVNDGIRQEGQQWGDEHGIEIDEYNVNKVEILKGPASLIYGSDAMAGVINMISFPTLPQGSIRGNILGNYQTNNGLIGYSGNIEGNLNGFVWDLRYSGKNAHAFQNKYDGFVYGSAFGESNYSGIIGLNKSWGYTHLHLNTYHLSTGIVEGERDKETGKFTKEVVVNDSILEERIIPESELRSYRLGIPKQDVKHQKVVLDNNFVLGKGNIKATIGFQRNQRKEFANVKDPDQYDLYFLLSTLNYDMQYLLPEKDNWHFSFGMNGMYQQSENKGTEFLIPAYQLFDWGGFFTGSKIIDRLNLSGGIRFDIRHLQSEDLYLDESGMPADPGVYMKFNGFSRNFSSFSGSAGAAYQVSEKVYAKLNLSRGFRTPNIAELGSNGIHEGTQRYEIGNPDLKAENSLQLDGAMGLNTNHVSAEIDLFNNRIWNFIYSEKLNNSSGGDSIVDPADPVPAFLFTQGNANLFGGEITIDIHPHPYDWLHFENSFAFVRGIRDHATDSTRYLPFIPAPKYSTNLRIDIYMKRGILKNSYVKIGLDHYFDQNKIYSAYGTETRTPGYTLLYIGTGTDIKTVHRTICSIYFTIDNLLDIAYQNHLSRLKYVGENPATSRPGVYNMGRNISLKLVMPISLKKQPDPEIDAPD